MKRNADRIRLLRFGRLVVEPPILLLGSDESEVQVTLADGEMITAEEQLRRMMATGALMDLREGDPTADQPSQGGQWGSERTVPAELLAELLTQHSGSQPPPRALRLAGARIIGVLDLEATELRCPLLLQDCWFERPVVTIQVLGE